MKITNLKKSIGNFQLHIEHMVLKPGKVHSLIGANGCGKSTLSKLIMGIHTADEGSIDYEGITLRDCTMVTQHPYLLHDTVYQNLIYPLKLRKIPVDDALTDLWLDKCSLTEKKNQYARSLSGGEQQKLAFARALIFSPQLVIIDETFSNLDPSSVNLFMDLIAEQQKKSPLTWIVISHQLVHVRRISDTIHFMANGQLLESGSVHDILLEPKNPAIRKYLADTEVSFEDKLKKLS